VTSGIYKITNIKNKKVYVGSSCVCIYSRKNSHWKLASENKHFNSNFQRDWNLQNGRGFKFFILEKFLPNKMSKSKTIIRSYTERREQFWIDKLKKSYALYNNCPVAGSRFGTTMPESAKRRIGKAFRGKVLSKEHREKLRIANKGQGLGRKLSKATRDKMSLSRKGRRLTDQWKKNISKGRMGIKFSAEHKMKLSLWQIGRKFSRSHRAKISKALLGNKNNLYCKKENL
jgi:group I intron endonuclease